MVPKMDKPAWDGVWPCLDPWDSVRLRTAPTHWNVPGKYGPHGDLFFFLLKKEPMVLSELVEFGRCVSAGLHMMSEENALRSDSDFAPDFGDMWRYSCPKSPMLSSDCVEWAGSEGTQYSSLEYYEHNVDNLALEVVGQNRSSEVISLFFKDWEVGRAALSCHLSKDLLCQEMRGACGESSESLGSPRSLCSECMEGRKRCSDAWVPSFNEAWPADWGQFSNNEGEGT